MDTSYGIAPPGHRLPGAARLGPVRLQVADLERSEEFYGRVLGLVRRADGAGHASLGASGGAEPLVDLVERRGARPDTPRGRIGLYHFAIVLPDRAELGRFALHARELGVRLGMADHLVSEALYLADPDGLAIEVYADRPRSTWRTSGRQLVMATDPLDLDGLVADAGTEPFDGVPPGTAMGHVHLHVGDLEGAARFYHEALGFDKVVWNYPGALFLSAGGYHHHVGTNVWAAPAPPAGPDDARLLWWTLVLPGEADVERVGASVRSLGYRVADRGTPGGLLVEDPWGTAIEVISASGSLT